MATLKDVAKLANVDVSTVSRALNNTSYVHPETRKKIFKAVEELSYRPNLLAKGLRQGKRHTIGVVIPTVNLSIFGEIVQGVEKQAGKQGYSIMICTTGDNPDIEEICLNRLRNGLVDGILIASTGQNGRLLRDIKTGGVSVLQIVRAQDKRFSSVVADYYACGYEAARYLGEKGCKNIGFINGAMELIPYEQRYKGYHRALKEMGLQEHMTKSSIPKGNYFQDGYQGVDRLLKEVPSLDGIMVAADMQGIGVMRALKERGKRVPEDVRVISLTGHSIGGMLETAITSMEMPGREMGGKAAAMIIEDIEAAPDEKPSIQNMVFQTVLAERETC